MVKFEEVHCQEEFPELPGWSFEIDEVSAGVYRGIARNVDGRTFEGTGVDPDSLLRWLKRLVIAVDVSRKQAR